MPDATPDRTTAPRSGLATLSPATLVALACLAQLICWSLVPSLLYLAPPIDVVEGYVFAPHWMLVTYKHPALPSWFLEATYQLTGATRWPAFVLTQVFIVTTLALLFLLGRDLMGAGRAATAVLLTTGIVYFSWISTEFNHNVAQMPLWAAILLAVWRGVKRGSVGWWLLAGALSGAICYAKFTGLLAPASAGLWMLLDRDGRRSLATPGPWLAALAFMLTAAPLILALMATDFSAISAAAARSKAPNVSGPFGFLARQVAACIPLAIIAVHGWRTQGPPTGRDAASAPINAQARAFILMTGLAPLLVTAVLAGVTGTGLRGNWAAAMLVPMGLVVTALLDRHMTLRMPAKAFEAALALTLIGSIGLGVAFFLQGGKRVARQHWPQDEIASTFRALWQKETGTPLTVVAGNAWSGGLIVIGGPKRPALLIDGDYAKSPWLTPASVATSGVLIVNEPGRPQIAVPTEDASQPVKAGTLTFKILTTRKPTDLTLTYTIIPPRR